MASRGFMGTARTWVARCIPASRARSARTLANARPVQCSTPRGTRNSAAVHGDQSVGGHEQDPEGQVDTATDEPDGDDHRPHGGEDAPERLRAGQPQHPDEGDDVDGGGGDHGRARASRSRAVGAVAPSRSMAQDHGAGGSRAIHWAMLKRGLDRLDALRASDTATGDAHHEHHRQRRQEEHSRQQDRLEQVLGTHVVAILELQRREPGGRQQDQERHRGRPGRRGHRPRAPGRAAPPAMPSAASVAVNSSTGTGKAPSRAFPVVRPATWSTPTPRRRTRPIRTRASHTIRRSPDRSSSSRAISCLASRCRTRSPGSSGGPPRWRGTSWRGPRGRRCSRRGSRAGAGRSGWPRGPGRGRCRPGRRPAPAPTRG